MFRRHWSGLPKDPVFPADLKGLGYFVNAQDEVRSIADPHFYFKFFLNRHPRINFRQRFRFDQALERLVHERLEKQGLQKVALPLGSAPQDRHVPVFVSPDLMSRARVVVIFGEPSQDLGVLAGRVLSGPGGIDKGSMVSVVQALQAQASSGTDSSPPGVVLANTGQLYWWPEGKRGLTVTSSANIPLPSMVHLGRQHVPALNSIPQNEDPASHVNYVFREVIGGLAKQDAIISLVAIGGSCELVTKFLDNEVNWAAWGDRLSSMLLLGHVYPDDGLKTPAFKEFLTKRTRAYVTSNLPLDTALAPPTGNAHQGIPNLGCPCYSSSEPLYDEVILIRALESALRYAEDAATTSGFENPPVEIVVTDEPEEREFTDEDWAKVPEDQKPWVSSTSFV
ncbi:putative arb2 domain-containing protein [Hirsutella rhossiliensis]|uniref:Arb2 domain-containing protein n=1 Tax=Hirsutella rhossiliensis TaxID=111463 RepID=A0A9P8MSI5_9HYPO|nr:putative arb2 domain-containing protein [Hirsutella rhossiliensis]KAH0958407.1 putative arb2 domain-containing protein [Hirsutella rhossiliensis]